MKDQGKLENIYKGLQGLQMYLDTFEIPPEILCELMTISNIPLLNKDIAAPIVEHIRFLADKYQDEREDVLKNWDFIQSTTVSFYILMGKIGVKVDDIWEKMKSIFKSILFLHWGFNLKIHPQLAEIIKAMARIYSWN